MLYPNRTCVAVAALFLASIACAVPGVTSPDTGAISTAVAQTVVASGLTQNVPAETLFPALESTPTATVTFIPELPTLTPTETLTPTLVFTPTPLIPLISVSVNTNCRNGPGKVYNMLDSCILA